MMESTPTVCPEFFVSRCDCGNKQCRSITFAMINPILRPLEDEPDNLAAMVQFPVEQAQALVDHIRKLAAERGVRVK